MPLWRRLAILVNMSYIRQKLKKTTLIYYFDYLSLKIAKYYGNNNHLLRKPGWRHLATLANRAYNR